MTLFPASRIKYAIRLVDKMAQPNREHAFLAPLGFKAVPIKLSEDQAAYHYLYAKEHKGRVETDKTYPQNCTLFVINVPVCCTEKRLSTVFSCCGHVTSVEVLDKPTLAVKVDTTSKYFNLKALQGYKVAFVVFKKSSGLQQFNLLKLQTPFVLSEKDNFLKSGIQKWIEDYETSLTDVGNLQDEIDQYMQEYDIKVAKKEEKAKEESVPDEEGWVTVTRKGRCPGLARTEELNDRVAEKEKNKKTQKEILNFYSWQHRNKKKEHLVKMRKKFEEDKQKIALMRAQRKFCPY